MAVTREEVINFIENMTVLELSQLVKDLEEKFGVSAAAPAAAVAMPTAGAVVAEAAEEQTEFDVVLKDFGTDKIQVIKVVRALTNLGLKEAKELVEATPKAVLEKVTKEVAEDAKKKLEEVKATVEIK